MTRGQTVALDNAEGDERGSDASEHEQRRLRDPGGRGTNHAKPQRTPKRHPAAADLDRREQQDHSGGNVA